MRSREAPRPAPASSIPAALVMSALFVVNLTVVGPHQVWAANVDEFNASFWDLLGPLAMTCAALTGVVALATISIARRHRHRAVVFLVTLTSLAWFEANGRIGRVGLLDDGALDLAALDGFRIPEAAVWLGVILLAQAFAGVLRRHATAYAAIVIPMQIFTLPFDEPHAVRELRARDEARLPFTPAEEIFELSANANYILVILDTVTGDTFGERADAEPARFDRAFAGFTFYPDTVGAFPSTRFAVPVMLGAPPYDNGVPVDDYLDTALRRDAITRAMLERRIEVDWVSAWPLFCRRAVSSGCFATPRPYGRPATNRMHTAAELLDLSLFRHVPAIAKSWVYDAGAWRIQPLLWERGAPPNFVDSAADFFDDWNTRVHVGREAPTFKILHTAGGHGPFVLDAACNRTEPRPYAAAGYEHQVRCSLRQTEAFLERLRALGAYDSATIVVASDHGASFGARSRGSHGLSHHRLSRARPLLAVKWPHAPGGLARSEAPASIQDIAPTLAAVAGLPGAYPGRDLATLAPDAERERDYGIYVQRKGTPGGFLERVERYAVGRDSRRPDAWRFAGAAFSPALDLGAPTVDADSEAHLSYLGWTRPSGRGGTNSATRW